MQHTFIHFKWAPLLTLFALFQLTGCFNNLRPELGRSCDVEATQDTCEADFECVYIDALDDGRCVPAGLDEEEINAAYEEDVGDETDGTSMADAGSSDGSVDGNTVEDAGSSDGVVDGTSMADAGSSDGTVDGTVVEDAGSSDGAVDGTVMEDAGSSDGAVDGSVVEDAGSSDGAVDGTMVEDAGSNNDVNACDATPCGLGTCAETDEGFACSCPAGYSNANNSCEYIPPTSDHITCNDNAIDPIVCQCAIGYMSDSIAPFQWNTTTNSWDGACIDVPEPDNSVCGVNGDGTKECSCPQGYEGTIEWVEFDWEGQCTLVDCPENTEGTTDTTSDDECTCEDGFTGDITWDETLQAWVGDCSVTQGPYECNADVACTVENDFDAVMGRDHFCDDYNTNSSCTDDDECPDNYFCLESGPGYHCAQPCGVIVLPEALRVEDRPGNILPPEGSGKLIWDAVNDATAYQVTVRPTNGTTAATTDTVVPSNDSLLSEFIIDGDEAHTEGTILEVCVAAKVDDEMGDDSCIFVFFAEAWEPPDCNDGLDQPQLPKLEPGRAYNLPGSWTLGNENSIWYLGLILKGKDPNFAPTNIVTFGSYRIRAEGFDEAPQPDGEPANQQPTHKTRWTLQATNQAGDVITESVEVNVPAHAFQMLHIEQTEAATHIHISDINGENMEELWEGGPGELGDAISLGKMEGSSNAGSGEVFLGHLFTTVEDDVYRYYMEDVADGASSISATNAAGSSVAGYAINHVHADGTSSAINPAPFCNGSGPVPDGECPGLPGNYQAGEDANRSLFFGEINSDFIPNLNSLFPPLNYEPEYTVSFRFMADSEEADDHSIKNILEIAEGPSILKMTFQRTEASGQDRLTFQLKARYNQTDTCEITIPDIVPNNNSSFIEIAFSHSSFWVFAAGAPGELNCDLIFAINGVVIETSDHRQITGVETLPYYTPIDWTFAGTQSQHGPTFGIDDLRVWDNISNAITGADGDDSGNFDCFLGAVNEDCDESYTPNAYFEFDSFTNYHQMGCKFDFTGTNGVIGEAHRINWDIFPN